MRALAFALFISALACGNGLAGKNQDGALIVHTNDARNYTSVGLCARFETLDNPGSCEAAGTRTDKDDATPALIWLIAAFDPSSMPGVSVIYYGLNHNLPPAQGYFANFGLCGPAGSIEVPDAGWPDTGGNSVAFGSPVVGDTFFPFYYLNAFGFAGAFVGTGINPTGGYAAFVSDDDPPVQDNTVRFGLVRWGTQGSNNCPELAEGACCFPDGACIVTPPAQCGGAYQGDGTVCSPNPCPAPEACCFEDGHCEDLFAADCAARGGAPQGPGSACAWIQCPQPSACCFIDGSCQLMVESVCGQSGGAFQGEGSTCEPNLCPQPTGACCWPDERCEIRTRESCNADGGSYRGDGTDCNPNQCTTGPCRGLARTTRKSAEPPQVHGGGRGSNPYDPVNGAGVACWSQGPNLDGIVGSSEVIGTFLYETELANDFIPNASGYIHNARWWGGYFNYVPGDPCVSSFNLRLYEDAGCRPGSVLCEYIVPSNANETYIYDQGNLPIFEYNWGVCCAVVQGNRYWFGAQAGDHPFPPQWGRLEAAGGVQLCDTVFKSAFLSYPDWVPAVDIFGVAFDCSQELTCVDQCVPQPGACCFDDGSCQVTNEWECAGSYQGNGTDCLPNPCPQPAACCFFDGTCRLLPENVCAEAGGTFQGEGTACEPNLCPQPAACCFFDGTCRLLPESVCAEAGGTFQGEGTACEPNLCPQPGACCFPDGNCELLTETTCGQYGGAFQGEETGCEPNLCPQPPTGACCIDNGCSVTTEANCAGNWLGADIACEPNPCPQLPTGACCRADGTCEIHTEEYCAVIHGSYQGDATGCEPNPCPQPTGACCWPGRVCGIRTRDACNAEGGTYRGDGTDCNPNPCPSDPCGGVVAATRTSTEPPSLHGGGRGSHPLQRSPRGVVCSSQGPNLDGLIATSEQILSLGLESELANDFMPNASGYIDNARWWGGYFNYLPGDPLACDFNLRFYEDGGCVPDNVLCEYIIANNNAQETFIYDQFGFPVYEYNWDVCCPVVSDNLYWFGVQAGDHPFPPQWGRLAANNVELCDTVFKSAFFAFPDWVPAIDAFGVSFDCAQEFTCVDNCGTIIETKSWGKIKALFGK